MTGCNNPLPEFKLTYQGVWVNQNTFLSISRQGRVEYEKGEGTFTTKISGPIKEFTHTGFSVGFGFLAADFVVQQPPKEVGGHWIMKVDGSLLTRKSQNSQ